MKLLLAKLSGVAVPVWAEARRGGDAMANYVAKQTAQTMVIYKRQVEVQTVIQTKYVDRVQKIYIQGVTIEANIPTYIQPADVDRFAVNTGFVRVLDAAWSGDPVGPAVDLDRQPSGLPLDEVAVVQVGNATSCRAWREQAIGWREFYAQQQIAINGKAGEWWGR